MTPSARLQAAIELLDAIIMAARDGGAAADTLIARYFKERRYAGAKDRRAVRDFVYTAIRMCSERPVSGRAAMLALVGQNPDLALLFDGSARGPTAILPNEKAGVVGHVPHWLVPHLAEPLQNMAEQADLLERAPLDIRVNALKSTLPEIMSHFPHAQPISGLPLGLRLNEGSGVEQSDAYSNGLFEIQDAGSQIIASICQAQPAMTVIDLCAGAGGKTLALAAAMRGEGRLIAADVNRDRLARLPERAQRAGANFIETLLLDAGKEAEALVPLMGLADIVLIDAPCSGTGTWRRNPEARWRLTPERLKRLVAEQRRILDFGSLLVKQGGRMVYAVCALTHAEGAEQIEGFLNRYNGWNPVTEPHVLGRKYSHGRLLTPAHDGTDGFFIAALVRS